MALKPHGFIPVVHAATKDRPDEIDTLISAEAVAAALAELGFVRGRRRRSRPQSLSCAEAARSASRLQSGGCGAGDGRLAPVIPSLLDAVGLPYTGAHSDALARDPVEGRDQAEARASRPADARLLGGRSRARSRGALHRQGGVGAWLAWARPKFGGEGRDVARHFEDRNALRHRAFCGTLHRGPRVQSRSPGGAWPAPRLPMAEILFENWDEGAPRIVGYDAKWTSDSEAYIGTPRRFGLEKPSLRRRNLRSSPSPAGTCSTSPATPGSTSASMPRASRGSSRLTSIPASTPMPALPPRQPRRPLLPRSHRQNYRCRRSLPQAIA